MGEWRRLVTISHHAQAHSLFVRDYTSWHEGEPNNVDNEDCLSLSGQDGYNWMDLQCQTRDHMGTMHYAVCENRKG